MTSPCTYFLIAVAGFLFEVAIAMGFLGGGTMRGSVGDMLAVVTVYFLIRPLFSTTPLISAVIAVISGFAVEFLQYIHLLEMMGVAKGNILYVVLGSTFSAADLVMYSLGGVVAYSIDRFILVPRLHKAQPV